MVSLPSSLVLLMGIAIGVSGQQPGTVEVTVMISQSGECIFHDGWGVAGGRYQKVVAPPTQRVHQGTHSRLPSLLIGCYTLATCNQLPDTASSFCN